MAVFLYLEPLFTPTLLLMSKTAIPDTPHDPFFQHTDSIIVQTLKKEFGYLPESDLLRIRSQTIFVCQTRSKKSEELSAKTIQQCTREQTWVWLIRRGSPDRQSWAIQQIRAFNELPIRTYLHRRYTFRTSDTVDDILSEAIRVLVDKIGKSVLITHLRNFLMSIANRMAKNHFQKKKNRISLLEWLEPEVFDDSEENDDESDHGNATYSDLFIDLTEDGEPDSVILHLPDRDERTENQLELETDTEANADKLVDAKELESEDGLFDDSSEEIDLNKFIDAEAEQEELIESDGLVAPKPAYMSVRVSFSQLKQAISDCLENLTDKKQLVLRLKHQFWKGYDGTLNIDDILHRAKKLDMKEIADLAGYSSAKVASQRLNEANDRLRDCLDSKLHLNNRNQ